MLTTAAALEDLRLRILAGYPLLLLRTYEEERWTRALGELCGEMEKGLVTWSETAGAEPPVRDVVHEPVEFLRQTAEYPEDHVFLLKDLHPHLKDAAVVRQLRDLIPGLRARRQSILLVTPVDDIPVELMKDLFVMELPLPGLEEIREVLNDVRGMLPADVQMDRAQEEHLLKAVLGLTAEEARKAFARALQNREEVDDTVYAGLVAEKRHMVQGSDLLEFFDLDESIDDIGGLEGLKSWINERAEAFSADAQSRGISNPKGVLLAGVQGCGKSLSAKAIARLLGFPLVRMDLSTLLESTRGSSEQNLREVLHTMETIAPSVLWLEEIDKAFAGFDAESTTDATIARIVGRFLTWLQEHTSPVFVVATANNVARLPPELLRRGRFDELFFVDLPNFYERKSIFEIHLKRRGWKPEMFDVEALANRTDEYSGAEIEQVVNSAIIESYSQGRMLTDDDLEQSRDRTVPLSVTMEDQIFALREWARTRCRPATLDSRLAQMMDEEERRGETNVADGSGGAPKLKWLELAEYGQIGPAMIEYVRFHDHVPLDQLVTDFAKFTETSGEYGLVLNADTKAVVWTRMSREVADQLAAFVAGKRLYLNPTKPDTYEQRKLELPTLANLPAEKLDRPAWMPMTLRLVPPVGGSSRYGRLARIKLGKRG
ncbi:MAG TPA: AAA family ATPase [Caulifigura sp.]|nr:AAA family ATPase [Caulifigura sp.]